MCLCCAAERSVVAKVVVNTGGEPPNFASQRWMERTQNDATTWDIVLPIRLLSVALLMHLPLHQTAFRAAPGFAVPTALLFAVSSSLSFAIVGQALNRYFGE